jgi:UDP-glucose 4-epimerase
VKNLRSLLALDNLFDLITRCLTHPAAVNQTFLVSDGIDLSTPDLICRLAKAMNRPARLVPLSPHLLASLAALFGKRHIIQRLCGSLQMDIEKTRHMLDWVPPFSIDSGLAAVARWYMDKHCGPT